jgi:hypothetical protein
MINYFKINTFEFKILHHTHLINNANKIINDDFFERKKISKYKTQIEKYYLNDNIDENMKMFQNKFKSIYDKKNKKNNML